MLAQTKELIIKVMKKKENLWYISGILIICINIVIIYFLIKLVRIRLDEIIPFIRAIFGDSVASLHCIGRYLNIKM